jgi:hypothetical protein
MDVKTETTHTYYIALEDDDMACLWKTFDYARDTMMRLPNAVDNSRVNEFMTEVERLTQRHTPVSGIALRME